MPRYKIVFIILSFPPSCVHLSICPNTLFWSTCNPHSAPNGRDLTTEHNR